MFIHTYECARDRVKEKMANKTAPTLLSNEANVKSKII